MTQATEQVTAPPQPTIEAMHAAAAQRKADAAEQYRAVLLRNEAPEPGDDVALGECMATLGRSTDDLAGDLQLVNDIEAASAAVPQRAALHDQLKVETQRNAATEAMIAEEQRRAALGWAARMRAANQAKRAAMAAFTQLRSLADSLPALEQKWAGVVGQPHRGRKPATPSVADPVEVKAAGQSRQAILDECHRLLIQKTAPPEGLDAAAWVNTQLVRGQHRGLANDELNRVHQIARPARNRVIGEVKSRLIDGAAGVDMKPAAALSAVQGALRDEKHRELSEDERAAYEVGEWPALACQVVADIERAESD